jgi:hypothetical protein
VKIAVAKNCKSSPNLLNSLTDDKSMKVLHNLSSNSSSITSVLEKIIHNYEFNVNSKNRKFYNDIIVTISIKSEKLSQFLVEKLHKFALTNKTLNDYQIRTLLINIGKVPYIPYNILEFLATYLEPDVREGVCHYKHLPTLIIEKLSIDSNFKVQGLILIHLKTSYNVRKN